MKVDALNENESIVPGAFVYQPPSYYTRAGSSSRLAIDFHSDNSQKFEIKRTGHMTSTNIYEASGWYVMSRSAVEGCSALGVRAVYYSWLNCETF